MIRSLLYKRLRRTAQRSGRIQITPRPLESLLRISEALAKMRLADFVSEHDVDRAIAIVLDSFFQSQKSSIRQEFERQFSQYLFQNNKHALVLDVIKTLMHKTIAYRQVLGVTYEKAIELPVKIKLGSIFARCTANYGSVDLISFFESDVFRHAVGMLYNPTTQTVV